MSTPQANPAPLRRTSAVSKRHIQARLVERGSSYRQFALARGYNPRTVTQAVDRWAGASSLPQGRLTFRILQELSQHVGCEVVPGILAEEPDRAVSSK